AARGGGAGAHGRVAGAVRPGAGGGVPRHRPAVRRLLPPIPGLTVSRSFARPRRIAPAAGRISPGRTGRPIRPRPRTVPGRAGRATRRPPPPRFWRRGTGSTSTSPPVVAASGAGPPAAGGRRD